MTVPTIFRNEHGVRQFFHLLHGSVEARLYEAQEQFAELNERYDNLSSLGQSIEEDVVYDVYHSPEGGTRYTPLQTHETPQFYVCVTEQPGSKRQLRLDRERLDNRETIHRRSPFYASYILGKALKADINQQIDELMISLAAVQWTIEQYESGHDYQLEEYQRRFCEPDPKVTKPDWKKEGF